MFGEKVDPSVYYKLFHNESGLVDGNCYGIVLNGLGIAVDGFPMEQKDPGSGAELINVKVKKVLGKINEIPALKSSSGGPQIDPVGSVFQTRNKYGDELQTIKGNGHFKGNCIANAQALVAKHKGEVNPHLDTSRLSIEDKTLSWIEGGKVYDGEYLCNGDSMFHVNKGIIGYKIDGVNDVYAVDCTVETCINHGLRGSNIRGDYEKSHPAQSLYGYNGASSRGFSISSSCNVSLEGCTVKRCHSYYSESIGVDAMFKTKNLTIKDHKTIDVMAGDETVDLSGYVGIQIGEEVECVRLSDLTYEKPEGQYRKVESAHLVDKRPGIAKNK